MLNLEAGFAKKLATKYSLFATFNYNPDYVTIMRNMKKRIWIPETKEWEIDLAEYQSLIEILESFNYPYNKSKLDESIKKLELNIIETKKQEEKEEIIDTSVLDNVSFKLEPRCYQKEGICYALNHDKFLLADEQGCGKTMQILNSAILKKKAPHCLIIVGQDLLQYNWLLEIKKHTNEKGYILGQKEIKKGKRQGALTIGSVQDRVNDLMVLEDIKPYFIITGIATLRASQKTEYTNKQGKKVKDKVFFVANIIEDLCKRGIIERVIVDEAQAVKNYFVDQTQALMKIVSCPYKIAATGTPIMNRNIDLYPILHWLGQEPYNYYSFRDTYCLMGGFKNKQIIGNKNTDLLHKKLKKCMLRRKKTDVLDLPDKIYMDEYLPLESTQLRYYNQEKAKAKQALVKCKGNKAIIMAMLTALRKATCHLGLLDASRSDSVKFERIVQLMEEITDNEQKAIIFSNWATPINMLREELINYNPAVITGETKDRMNQMIKFQENESCKVILGTYGAMGTGVTLTAASNIIILDEPWNRAVKDQAVDRAHRIGTKTNVNIYTLMCKDSVDDLVVHKKVLKKGALSDEIVDGELIQDIEELLS